MNKTFIRNVQIQRNVTHQHDHVHLHGINVDNLLLIIVGYVLLMIAVVVITVLITYGIKERSRLLARIRAGADNMALYS